MVKSHPRFLVPDPRNPLAIRFRPELASDAPRQVELSWGDGTTQIVSATSLSPHTYPVQGAYNILARKTDDATVILAQQTVLIRESVEPIGYTVGIGGDPNFVRFSFVGIEGDKTDVLPHLRLEWPDGTTEHHAIPGTYVERSYQDGSVVNVKVTDLTTMRPKHEEVHVVGRVYAPEYTLAEAPGDATHMTAEVTLGTIGTGRGGVIIYRGDDDSQPTKVPTAVTGQKITFQYPEAGRFLVLIMYGDETSTENSRPWEVVVPFPQA
jgi:hypothetical protein